MKQVAVVCFVLLLILSGTIFAQEEIRPYLVVNAGFISPTGDFGKELGDSPHQTRRFGYDFGNIKNKVGLAQQGVGFGVELVTPLPLKGFDWILGSHLLINEADSDDGEALFRAQRGDSVYLKMEFGRWYNIPLMSGIRYNFSLTSGISISALAQAGINFSRPASFRAYTPATVVEETSYDLATDFGFQLGAGLALNHKINFEVRYWLLGTPTYQGNRTISKNFFPQARWIDKPIIGERRSVSMLTFSLGYSF